SGNLANCTFPTLNQNTSGTSAGLTGTPSISVTNLTVSGTTSFAAGSIADAALATGFLPLAGGTMTGALEMTSGLAVNWNADTGVSRLAANVVGFGNGT